MINRALLKNLSKQYPDIKALKMVLHLQRLKKDFKKTERTN